MSYAPTTDFLALLRLVGKGVRTSRLPGLDFIVAALARAGLIKLWVGQTAPLANQAATAWFKPAIPSFATEGVLFLWDATVNQYAAATPALWNALLDPGDLAPVVQDVATIGPVNVGAASAIVRVLNVGAPVSLVMPPAATLTSGGVLVSDWANLAGTNAIHIAASGGDVFPNGLTALTINADGGSVLLRPVPGGYVL